jgi:hypothetical protein
LFAQKLGSIIVIKDFSLRISLFDDSSKQAMKMVHGTFKTCFDLSDKEPYRLNILLFGIFGDYKSQDSSHTNPHTSEHLPSLNSPNHIFGKQKLSYLQTAFLSPKSHSFFSAKGRVYPKIFSFRKVLIIMTFSNKMVLNWNRNYPFTAKNEKGLTVIIDAPLSLGGEKSAPFPI